MDFLPVYKGVLNIVVSLGVAAGSTLTPSPSIAPQSLQSPGTVEAYNIPAEHFDTAPSLVISGETLASDNSEVEQLKEVIVPAEPSPSPEVIIGPIQPQTVVWPGIKEAKAAEKSEEDDEVAEVKPSVSPSATSTPVASATPTTSPSATSSPTAAPNTVSLSDNSQRMFDMVNDYRKSKGMASFEKDGRLCEIAQKRAPQVDAELASGTLHKGFKDLNLPYWATENIVAYSSLEQNLKFWLSDYIHKKAIESDNKYSCTACAGTSCSQIFTSFVAK